MEGDTTASTKAEGEEVTEKEKEEEKEEEESSSGGEEGGEEKKKEKKGKKKKSRSSSSEEKMKGRKVIVVGASGAIGKSLVLELLQSPTYSRITTLGRRKIIFPGVKDVETENTEEPTKYSKHEKLDQQIVNFDQLDQHEELFDDQDALFCCLGTTIKTAGSQEAFKKVDYGYTVNAARLGKTKGIKHFSLVTSIGADPKSSVYYSRVKGETEQAVKELGYTRFSIYRPSLLIADRTEKRTGEKIAQAVSPWISWTFVGPLKKYKEIAVEDVALAMRYIDESGIEQESKEEGKVSIYESDLIQKMADEQKNKKTK